MDARDPFDSIAEHCRISSSQNERLCHRRFAGLPEEIEHDTDSQLSEEIEEELSGIMMVTPSSSSEDEENDCGTPKDNEIFQTPPENSQMASSNDGGDDRTIVVVEEEEEPQQQQQQETEDEKAVDLGADTDLRFSEVELSQDSINEVMQSELKKIRVLKRELAASERLIESLKKKSKSSGNNLNSQSPKPCIKGTVEQIMKSLGKLNSNIDSPYHCGGKSLQTSQNSEATDKGLRFTEDLEQTKRSGEVDRSVCNNGNGKGTANLCQKNIENIESEANGEKSLQTSQNSEATDKGLIFTEDLEHTERSGEGDRSVCNNGNGKGTANLSQKNIENIESEANRDKSLQTSQNGEATDKGLRFTENLEHTERSVEGDRSVCNNGNGKGTANLSQKNIEDIESEANGEKSLQTRRNSEAIDKGLRFTEDLEHTQRSGGVRSVRNNVNGKGTPNLSQKNIEDIESEANGDKYPKRKLDFSTPNLELETEATENGVRCSEDLEYGRNGEGDRSVCNNGNGKGTANLSQKNIKDIESEANGGKSLQTSRNSEAIDKGLRFTEDLEHTQRSGEGVRSVLNNVNGKGTPNLSQKNIENIESEANGDKYPKRKLDFSTRNLELETEATGKDGVRCSEDLEYGRNGEGDRSACKDGNGEGRSNFGQKSIDDIDKHRLTGPSVRNSSEIGRTEALRALPVSICGPEEDKDMRNNHRNTKLLDVLRMLSRNNDYYTALEGKSILDVARSRGITFP